MNFLAPLFLLGAAAVALPVVFHLIRRTTRDRIPFGSLLFLKPSPPRVTRRSRIEHWLLLLLRCAAIALLAGGFARPFLRNRLPAEPTANPARRIALLLDLSASMQRAGLWNEALERADRILRDAGPADQVAVFTFSRELAPVFGFAEWNAAAAGERVALAQARLAGLRPGWSATHLGDALVGAVEALGERDDATAGVRRELILLSDLQEGARLGSLQGFDWPRDVRLVVESLRPATPGNAGLQLVAETVGASLSTSAVVRVRVSNSADARVERFRVGWSSAAGAELPGAQDVYVPPGQSRIVSLAAARDGSSDQVRLWGDDHTFDNAIHALAEEVAPLPALYLGEADGDSGRQPLYFLRRALPVTRQVSVQLTALPAAGPVPAAAVEAAKLIFVTEAVSPPTAALLRRAVVEGRTLVFAPRTPGAAEALAQLAEAPSLRVEEVPTTPYALLGDLDFRHPLLAPFADPRFSDFTRIHFWKYRRIDAALLPGARVVARFDSGDPAWVDVPAGRGRILVLTAGWHPEDSQLALSTKFVPLLFSVLEWSGATTRGDGALLVDHPLPLPQAAEQGDEVRAPDGTRVPLAPGATTFAATRMPGVYQWTRGTSARRFALNLDPAESLTAPRSREAFDALGLDVAETSAPTPRPPQVARQLAAAETESRQKLWRWLLLATLIVALLETAIAGWRTRTAPPAAPS